MFVGLQKAITIFSPLAHDGGGFHSQSDTTKDIFEVEEIRNPALFRQVFESDNISEAMVVGPEGLPLDLFFKLDLKKLFRR